MSRLCKNCRSKKKSSTSVSKNQSFQSPHKYIQTEYGLAKVLSPDEMHQHSDDYMIASYQRTNSKVKKLEKELRKVKKRLEECQYGVSTVLNKHSHRPNSSVESMKLYQSKGSKARSSNTEGSVSRNVSETSSKKRQIGRFTKFSDSLLPAPEADPNTSQNYTPKSKKTLKPEIAQASSTYSEQVEEDGIGQYLPESNDHNISHYSNQSQESKQQRLNRRFEDLILIEKTAPQEQRKQIRKQIAEISRMLANDSYY